MLLQSGPKAMRILFTISLSYRHLPFGPPRNLRFSPVIVPSSSSNSKPELITYSTVRKLISSTLCRPLIVFRSLAEALSALEAGDGSRSSSSTRHNNLSFRSATLIQVILPILPRRYQKWIAQPTPLLKSCAPIKPPSLAEFPPSPNI
jgi:hypothetical protein